MGNAASGSYRVLVLSTFPYPRDRNTALFVKDLIKYSAPDFRFTVVAPVPLLPWEPRYSWKLLNRCREELLQELANVDDIIYVTYRVIPKMLLPLSALSLLIRVGYVLNGLGKTRRFCCIHAHSLFPEGWVATVLGGRLNVPVVCTVHGSDLYNAARRWYLREYASRVIKEADSLIVVSRTLLRELRGFFPFVTKRRMPPAVISNGVDLDELRAAIAGSLSAEDEEVLRSARTKGHAVILWVGGLRPIKQPDIAVKAFKVLVERRAAATLVILGDGPARHKLHRDLRINQLEDKVILLGKRPHRDTLNWIHNADVLLLTSQHEGFSGVTLEAAMLGTPVVAPRVGGPEDLITTERGIIYKTMSPEAIARALEDALQRPWERRTFAPDLAEYDWRAIASRVGQQYRIVLERKNAG